MEYLGIDKAVNQIEPLVSVCVQTYQHAPYIREGLDSILMQKTDFPLEIILGEDESADGTREICVEYAEKHPEKIRLFLRSRKDVIYINGRPAGRFNFIENLRAARGKYIALCEGDDYWTDPLKLQKQVDFLENNSKYVGCFHNALKSNGKLFHSSEFYGEYGIADLFGDWLIPTASLMLKNEQLTKSDFKFFEGQVHGDYSLVFLLMQHGSMYCLPDSIFSYYRLHNNGISKSFYKRSILMTMSHDMVRMKALRGDLGDLYENRLLRLIEKTQSDILLLNRTSTYALFKIILKRLSSKLKIK